MLATERKQSTPFLKAETHILKVYMWYEAKLDAGLQQYVCLLTMMGLVKCLT
jgi:hypothetical protein